MTTKINILNKNERTDFNNPPKFNADLRAKFFDLSDDMRKRLNKFKSETNMAGFIQQCLSELANRHR